MTPASPSPTPVSTRSGPKTCGTRPRRRGRGWGRGPPPGGGGPRGAGGDGGVAGSPGRWGGPARKRGATFGESGAAADPGAGRGRLRRVHRQDADGGRRTPGDRGPCADGGAAGRHRQPASARGRVTLVVSIGAPTITVPDLRGLTLEEARLILEQAGLTLGTYFRRTSDERAGTIIHQTPAPGTLG